MIGMTSPQLSSIGEVAVVDVGPNLLRQIIVAASKLSRERLGKGEARVRVRDKERKVWRGKGGA